MNLSTLGQAVLVLPASLELVAPQEPGSGSSDAPPDSPARAPSNGQERSNPHWAGSAALRVGELATAHHVPPFRAWVIEVSRARNRVSPGVVSSVLSAGEVGLDSSGTWAAAADAGGAHVLQPCIGHRDGFRRGVADSAVPAAVLTPVPAAARIASAWNIDDRQLPASKR